MLSWALAFLVAALIVAIPGFTGGVTTLTLLAQVLFWIFLIGVVANLAVYLPGRIHFIRGLREHRRRGV